MTLLTPPSSGRQPHIRIRIPSLEPSLPIAIPAVRNAAGSKPVLPACRALSPDLLFEMSPVSLHDPSTSGLGTPGSPPLQPEIRMSPLYGRLFWRPPVSRTEHTAVPQEPFMYPFPFCPRSEEDEPALSPSPLLPHQPEQQTPASSVLAPIQDRTVGVSELYGSATLAQVDHGFRFSPAHDDCAASAGTPTTTSGSARSVRGHVFPSFGRAPYPTKTPRLHHPLCASCQNAATVAAGKAGNVSKGAGSHNARNENDSPNEFDMGPQPELERHYARAAMDARGRPRRLGGGRARV